MPGPPPRLAIADLICQALAAAGLGTYNTTGATIFRGAVRGVDQPGIPVAAIFVKEEEGPAQPYLGAAQSGSLHTTPVRIRIRGAIDDSDGAETTAQAVYDALHTKAPVGTAGCWAQRRDYLGPDLNGNSEWLVEVLVKWAGP